MYCNLGSDSVVHISEEVTDASKTVPRVMWWSYILNVILGIIMLIVMLFCIGPLDSVLDSDVPYLLLFNNTGSNRLSLALNVILFLLIYAGNITALATCGREMWAFARDKGLPFSTWVGRMYIPSLPSCCHQPTTSNKHHHRDPKWQIPFNSIYATSIIVALLCLIQLGSTVAFNIIVSLSVLGLLSTYMISIGCVLLKRLRHEPLPLARWSLGRYGLAINAFAFFYSAFIIVWACFPVALPVDAGTANWSPVVWVAVMLFSVAFYWGYGTRYYTAPVDFVEGRKAEGVGLQSS